MLEAVSAPLPGWREAQVLPRSSQAAVPGECCTPSKYRFVNVKDGAGKNIPCDLYNEHINKLIKVIITNMGPNLTEASLQRAARSVSTLHSICENLDLTTGVPVDTTAHSTRPDAVDVQKVTDVVLQHSLLRPGIGRSHTSFRELGINPLKKWNISKTLRWIRAKQREYLEFKEHFRGDGNQSDSDASD